MANGTHPNDDDLNTQQGAGASSENPADGVNPNKSAEEMNAEASRRTASPESIRAHLDEIQLKQVLKEIRDKEAAEQALYVRLQYFSKQYGAQMDPDPRTLHLIAGVDTQGKNMITYLKDGKSAILDTGKGFLAMTEQFNDDVAQVMASQILAKKWEVVKVKGSEENRRKLAANLLALDPDVKIKGIAIDQSIKKYAQMLRETRGLGNGEATPEAPQQTGPENNGGNSGMTPNPTPDNNPPSPSGNYDDAIDVEFTDVTEQKLLPHTPDFPVAGEAQQKLETELGERAAALDDIRQENKFRGVTMNAAQFREFDNINNVLNGIQNATPQERGVYQKIIKTTMNALETAPKENIPTILSQASALVDKVREVKEKEAQTGKTSALGVQGLASIPLDNIKKAGMSPSLGPKPPGPNRV